MPMLYFLLSVAAADATRAQLFFVSSGINLI
jgi:hypothetical protein